MGRSGAGRQTPSGSGAGQGLEPGRVSDVGRVVAGAAGPGAIMLATASAMSFGVLRHRRTVKNRSQRVRCGWFCHERIIYIKRVDQPVPVELRWRWQLQPNSGYKKRPDQNSLQNKMAQPGFQGGNSNPDNFGGKISSAGSITTTEPPMTPGMGSPSDDCRHLGPHRRRQVLPDCPCDAVAGWGDVPPTFRRGLWLVLAAALVWVVVVRIPLILNAEAHLDSDLAVDGLTLGEAVRGHWRWHYPGTPHIGTLPVLLSWPQAHVGGPTRSRSPAGGRSLMSGSSRRRSCSRGGRSARRSRPGASCRWPSPRPG